MNETTKAKLKIVGAVALCAATAVVVTVLGDRCLTSIRASVKADKIKTAMDQAESQAKQKEKDDVAATTAAQQRLERDQQMWEYGRQYGYYQSFIDMMYLCNEYSAIDKDDSRVIYRKVAAIPNPHKGVK